MIDEIKDLMKKAHLLRSVALISDEEKDDMTTDELQCLILQKSIAEISFSVAATMSHEIWFKADDYGSMKEQSAVNYTSEAYVISGENWRNICALISKLERRLKNDIAINPKEAVV